MLWLERRRWWAREGLPALRILAVEFWDPIGVYDDPMRVDAYDPYLERAGRMLRRGSGAPELARYLGEVRTKAFRRDPNEEADASFADRVLAWYALEAPQRQPRRGGTTPR
ncbi:MAG TPA: hypothetical protein VIB59_00880 [Solirubrobacteraceae bacterium]|jgi:hypothetical protein